MKYVNATKTKTAITRGKISVPSLDEVKGEGLEEICRSTLVFLPWHYN
jgi:hypothetical protein